LLAFLLLCPAFAQDLRLKLTQAQAIHDIETLVGYLESTHPDPYINGGGKVAFKRRVDDLARSIPAGGITVRALGDYLDPFLASVKDGHTQLYYYTDKWRDPAYWLPVRFCPASDGLFVCAFDLPELRGTLGWRLTGINGVPMEELIRRRAEDSNAENLYGTLGRFTNIATSLKFVNNLVGNITAESSVTYNLQAPTGKRENRIIPWSARRKWDAESALAPLVRWNELKRSPDDFWYQFFDRPTEAAYLRMATIMPREAFEIAAHGNRESARGMVDRFYAQRKQPAPSDLATAIQGIPSLLEIGAQLLQEMKRRRTPALIIDLRGNSGGWTPSVEPFLQALYGESLYARPRPGEWVRVESELYLAKYGQTLAERRQKDPSFRLGRYIFSTDQDRRPAEEQRLERVRRYQQAKYSFADKVAGMGASAVYTPRHVIVLCDPGTGSAAFHTMMYLRNMGAKVVGVPSGQSPNAFMELTEFTLPESKLRGSISNSAQVFKPEDPKARVTMPDFPVTVDIYQRYGFDTEAPLRYALDLLAERKL
jgi:hypothetical protein